MERLPYPPAAGFAASLGAAGSTITDILTGAASSTPNSSWGPFPLRPKTGTCCYATATPIQWRSPGVLGTAIPSARPHLHAPHARTHTPLHPGAPSTVLTCHPVYAASQTPRAPSPCASGNAPEASSCTSNPEKLGYPFPQVPA